MFKDRVLKIDFIREPSISSFFSSGCLIAVTLAEDPKRYLLKPKEREYHLYAAGELAIIVKDFISESPVTIIDDITTPCLEKTLVDATIATELEFARGSEIYHI